MTCVYFGIGALWSWKFVDHFVDSRSTRRNWPGRPTTTSTSRPALSRFRQRASCVVWSKRSWNQRKWSMRSSLRIRSSWRCGKGTSRFVWSDQPTEFFASSFFRRDISSLRSRPSATALLNWDTSREVVPSSPENEESG